MFIPVRWFPSIPILTHIQDNSLVKVDFHVPEKYARQLTTGSLQKFTVASNTTQYNAKVIAREAGVDQNTRTLLVRAVSSESGQGFTRRTKCTHATCPCIPPQMR